MVRLVMYSDQVIPENGKVDARLLDLWPDGAALTIHFPGGATRAFLDCLRDNELMATLGD